ncbi:MAG TPA: hypothetical protein VN669_07665 [Candidatus Acidoferrales bacterium]|jgi:hypothetical protein|nr:hypothetical protein [Candidatus Acidoferrales bacterium]
MASPGLPQPSRKPISKNPAVLYIAAPLALLGFHWVIMPVMAHAPGEFVASDVMKLVWSTLISFLIAYYAASVRRTRNWHSFSQWFGAWLLLYAVLYPLPNGFVLWEIFELAKRRVRRHHN